MKGNDELRESIEELKVASFGRGMYQGLAIGFVFGLAVATLIFYGVFR